LKLRVLEWLRGAAALSVAMAHADAMIGGNPALSFPRWHDWSFPGTAGVEFFFVLSGFVMGVAHGAQLWRGGSVPSFLWRRCRRIYPLFWVMLAVPVYRFWGAPSVTPGSIAAWASLLPVRTDNLLVVAWTLRQEMTFYLMLALCLLPRIGPLVLASWVLATVTHWFILPLPVPAGLAVPVSHVLSLFNFEFFAGLAAGLLFRRVPLGAGLGGGLLAAGVALVAWRMAQDGWGAEYGPVSARPLYGLGYAAVLLGAATLERRDVLRFGPVGTRLALAAGALSYPLYLSHLLTLDAVAEVIGPAGLAARLGPGMTFALLLAGAVLGAALVAVLIDRPLQRALQWLSAGSRSKRPVPEAA